MHSPLGRRVGMLAAGGLVISGLGLSGAAAAGDPQVGATVVGSSAWYPQAYDNFPTGGYLTPRQSDVVGPQRAPFGTSSHKITIGESSAQTELYRTNEYDGVALADLTRLEYSEFARHADGGSDRQPVYLRLSVDNDGTDDTDAIDASLFFYPANNPGQQLVENGTWQSWDVAGGTIDVDGDNGGTTTLAAYASAHPDAVLVNAPYDELHDAGALSLIAGGSLAGDTDPQIKGEYFVDRVIVGENGQDTLYDFGGNAEEAGATTGLTVSPSQLQGWRHQAYDNVDYFGSNQEFVDGPGVPPAGGGSLQSTIDSAENTDRVELFRTTQYDDTLVRDLRELSYSTYVRADVGNTTPQQPHYLRLSVDNDGDGGTDDTLFFFPANNSGQQAVANDVWQTWSAGDGLWNIGSDTGVPGAITLEDYVVAHPDATIVENGDAGFPEQPRGGVAFMVGAAGENQRDAAFFLDDVTITAVDSETGTTVTGTAFDLEDTPPTLAIGDATVSEGNAGAALTFPVTLSRAFPVATTVAFATSNGTAKAGSDYRATSGTVTVPAGSTTAAVTVPVVSDMVGEGNETLAVTLTSPVGATIADGSAVGTIVDDDTTVGLVLRNATQQRVRAVVSTVPAAAGAPVKVFRVTKSGQKRVLSATLNDSGRISVRLDKHYRSGAKVKMIATVRTDAGLYRSERVAIRVR